VQIFFILILKVKICRKTGRKMSRKPANFSFKGLKPIDLNMQGLICNKKKQRVICNKKKIQELKQKKYEFTETKIIFKPC
jgi:hypothetical protein